MISIHHVFQINTFVDKLGYVFNSTALNVTSSTATTGYSGLSCIKSSFKAFAAINPLCKVCYGVAAVAQGTSLVISSICLIGGASSIAPAPATALIVGYLLGNVAKGCTLVGDCMEPTSGLTEKAVEKCIQTGIESVVGL